MTDQAVMHPNPPIVEARQPRSGAEPLASERTRPLGRWAILLLLALTLPIGGIGFFAFQRLRDGARGHLELTLTAIAEEKRQRIEQLLARSMADAKLYATGNALMPERLASWLQGDRKDLKTADWIQGRLVQLAKERGWRGVAIYDSSAKPAFAVGEVGNGCEANGVREVLREPHIDFVDLHPNGRGGVDFGTLTPISYRDGPVQGVFCIAWPAERELFPLAQRWPIPTQTGETYLVRREGDTARPLSPLRQAEPPAPIPLQSPHAPAARAARGERGILTGAAADGRGDPLLAYATSIADSPWLLIAQIDEGEADASVRATAWTAALASGLALLCVYTLGYLLWRRDRQGRERQALRREQALEAERLRTWQLLDAIANASTDAIFAMDTQGRCLFLNGAAAAMTGARVENALGRDETALFPPAQAARAMADNRRAMDEDRPLVVEERLAMADGEHVMLTTKGPLHDAEGRVVGVFGISRDITERKRAADAEVEATAAAARHASERRLATLVDQGLAGIAEMDLDGHPIRVNDRFCQIVGHPRERLLGARLSDFSPPEDWRLTQAALGRLRDGGPPEILTTRYRRADGGTSYAQVSLAAMRDASGNPNGFLGLATDLTAIKEAEERQRRDEEAIRTLNAELEQKVQERTAELVAAHGELQDVLERVARSESRFRTIFEKAPLGVVLLESDAERVASQAGLIVEANRRFAEIVGRPLEQVVGRDWMSLTHPDDIRAGLELRTRLSAGEIDGFRMTKRYVRPDGSSVWANLTLVPIVVGAGEPPRHLCVVEDIAERKALEAALAASEERYRLALEASREAVWDQDLITGAIVVNDRAYALLGYAPGELDYTVDLWKSHLHPDDAEATVRAAEAALVGDAHSLDVEYRIVDRSGEIRWLRSVAGVVQRDAAGRPTRWVGTNEDISDRVRARAEIQEALQRLRLATMVADVGIWTYDTATERLEWDERMCELYEVPPESGGAAVSHRLWASRVHPEDLERTEASLRHAVGNLHPFRDTFRIRLPSGRIRHIQSAAIVERDRKGLPLRLLGVNRDVTAQYEQEEALRAAKQAAEVANAAKTEFLAHMSHEIRTPLNAVLGLAQVLAREPLSTGQRDLVERIGAAGQSLLAILNDVLDMSKIEAGRLRIEARPFELATLLAHLDALLGQTARAKGLALSLDLSEVPSGALVGDALRLEQVLVNLLGNAIKFTERGEVRLRVRCLEHGDDAVRLRFEVRDTGIGIAPAALDRLFAPFAQADTGIARRFGGTGLGLAICKRLVELMGGEIGAESQVGVGSTFQVELSLPRATEAELAALGYGTPRLPAPSTSPRLAGARLLVVDDSAANRDLVERALALEGAASILAADGQQALEILKANPGTFDAVLMDIRMPGMDGLSATRSIRADLGLSTLPVVALTAGVLADEREAALSAGVDAVLPKPLDLEEMTAVLGRWIAAPPTPPTTAVDPAGAPAASPEAPELPPIPGIEPGRVHPVLTRDRPLFLRLLARLADDFGDAVASSRHDLAAGNRESATRRMHTLRGDAANLGATAIAESARALEESLATGLDPSSLEGSLAGLERQLAALVAASATWQDPVRGPHAEASPAVGAPPTPERLLALRESLRTNNTKARRLLEELEPALALALGQEATRALGAAVRDLRFADALEILDRLDPEG